jgi:hypothetical protein
MTSSTSTKRMDSDEHNIINTILRKHPCKLLMLFFLFDNVISIILDLRVTTLYVPGVPNGVENGNGQTVNRPQQPSPIDARERQSQEEDGLSTVGDSTFSEDGIGSVSSLTLSSKSSAMNRNHSAVERPRSLPMENGFSTQNGAGETAENGEVSLSFLKYV